MDICSREYMFASELITNVMQLHSSKWEPDVKALYENASPFTPTVKKTIDYIWNEKKQFINDLFSTVLKLGTINMTNYEVAVKFASHLVTEAEYDEIELLRFCVIAAGYATLFYQNGLTNVPDRCLRFIYDTIITFKSKNEFNDESWPHIELLGDAYTKESQSKFSTVVKPCFVKLSKIDCMDRNFQEVCDRNAVNIVNENRFPKAIEEPLLPRIKSGTVPCTSEEDSTNIPKTKNVKRKRTRTTQEIKQVEGVSGLYTKTTTNAVPEEVADVKAITKDLSVTTKHRKRRVIHKNKATRLGGTTSGRSKKITKTVHKFTKNTGSKESVKEVADTKNVTQWESKNRGKISPLTKYGSTEVKSTEGEIEMIDVINLPADETSKHCENKKCIECTINKLKATKHRIKKDSKFNSKEVKRSKTILKSVTMAISALEKYTYDKYASEKTTSNKDTDQEISNEETPRVSREYTDNVCTKNKPVSEEVSDLIAIEKKFKENRPKSNNVKSNKYNQNRTSKGNKHLKKKNADYKLDTERSMSTYYEEEKIEKINDKAKNVETIQNDIGNINIASDTVTQNSDDKYTIVNNTNIIMKVSKSSHAAKKERTLKSMKIKRIQNETNISILSSAGTFRNATEKATAVPFTNPDQESKLGVWGTKVSKSNQNELKLKIKKTKRIQNESSVPLNTTAGTFQNATEKAVTVPFTNECQTTSNVDVLGMKVSKSNDSTQKERKLKSMKTKRIQNESSMSLNATSGTFHNATKKAVTVPFTKEYQTSNVDVLGMKVSKGNDSTQKERKIKSMKTKRIQNESSMSLNATSGTFQNVTEKPVTVQHTNKDQQKSNLHIIEYISPIKSKSAKYRSTNVMAKSDETKCTIQDDVGLKCKKNPLNESIDVCVANEITSDVSKRVAEAISDTCKNKITKSKYENARKEFEETKYENASKGKEETKYGNTSKKVGNLNEVVTDTKYVSKTCTENNNELKAIPKVRIVKLIKCRIK